MSYEDTIVKTLMAFGVLVVGAVAGWNLPPIVWIAGAVIGFVLALVNTFKKKPSAGLVLAYAFFEGLFVGGISGFYNSAFEGIVTQAVFGTLGVFFVTLLLFRSGKVRATPKATKFFLVAIVGYMAFSLVNLVLMWTGVTSTAFGLLGVTIFGIPLGVVIGIFVVIMAAYSLILDFDQIKTVVQRGARASTDGPRRSASSSRWSGSTSRSCASSPSSRAPRATSTNTRRARRSPGPFVCVRRGRSTPRTTKARRLRAGPRHRGRVTPTRSSPAAST